MSGVINKTYDGTALDVAIEGIFLKEKRYFLTPLEHRILSGSESTLQEWAKRFLLVSVGLFLTVTSKLIIFLYNFSKATSAQEKDTLDLNIQSWEVIYLCIGIFLTLLFYFLGMTKLNRSEKSNVLNNIKKYFDEK